MARSIGNLFASIGLTSTEFQRGIRDTERSLKSFAKDVSTTFETISSSIAVPLAGAAGFAGLEELVRSSVDAQVSLRRMADSLGISTQKLAELQYAFIYADVGAEEFNGWMMNMVKNLGLVTGGLGRARPILEAMGLDAKKIASENVTKQFTDIYEALQKMPNAAQRSAAASRIFGEQMAAAILGTKLNLKDLADQADKVGFAMSDLNNLKVDQVSIAFKVLKADLTGIGNSMALVIAPLLSTAVKGFSDWTINAMGAKNVTEALMKLMMAAAPYVYGAYNGLRVFFDGLKTGFSAIGLFITNFIDAIYSGMTWVEGEIIIGMTKMSDQISILFRNMELDILDSFKGLAEKFGVSGLFPGLDKTIEDVKSKIKQATEDIQIQGGENPNDVAEKFFNMEGFGEKIADVRTKLAGLTVDYAAATKAGIKAFDDPDKGIRQLKADIININAEFDKNTKALLKDSDALKNTAGSFLEFKTNADKAAEAAKEFEKKWANANKLVNMWIKDAAEAAKIEAQADAESKRSWDKLIKEYERDNQEHLNTLKHQYDTYKDDIVNGVTDMITGVKGAWSNMLSAMAKEYLNSMVKKILFGGSSGSGGLLSSLFGGGGSKSSGTLTAFEPITLPNVSAATYKDPFTSTASNITAPGSLHYAPAQSNGNGITIVQNLSFGEGVNYAAEQAILNAMPKIKEQSVAAVRDAQRRNGGKL